MTVCTDDVTLGDFGQKPFDASAPGPIDFEQLFCSRPMVEVHGTREELVVAICTGFVLELYYKLFKL